MKNFNASNSCFLLFLLILTNPPGLSAQTLPEGFTTVAVASGMEKPVAMAFAPDGRIFVTEQGGAVRVIKNGSLLATPLIQLKVNPRGEAGLVGIAVDPDFSSNQYVYLYYTIPDGTRNRISRFKCTGDVASPATENIILTLDARASLIHHGGAMHFKDRKMFVAIGDDANGANAQNLDTYHGKIIRINADGSIPAGNPYASGSEQRRRIWAYGLRNPFTFDIQPGTGRIFVNDVGLEMWEEVNDITLPGKNLGWPNAQGNSTNAAYTNPFFAYSHGRFDEFGCAITGGAFFNPVQTNYPAKYVGRYFFQDYCSQWIKVLDLSVSPVTVESFATEVGGDALYLTTGNDGNLYYLSRTSGSLHKIIYSSNEAPQIIKHPSSVSISSGQSASFSVTVAGKTPFAYQWRKDGVNITGATAATFSISQTTSGDAGDYSVKVSNSLGSVVSNSARLTITASNERPVAQILKPSNGSLYRAGDVISFSGAATDREDGDLSASWFTWLADFHHDTHRHDGPPVAAGTKSGSLTIPTRGETSDNVWYRLYLVVKDSQGATDTAWVEIYPRKSTMTLKTEPEGLKVRIDGQPMDAPLAVVSVENLERSIGAVSPQTSNGRTYVFDKWLHGGMETQTVFTPLEDDTYTVVYRETTANPIQREVWNGIRGLDVSAIPVNTPPDEITPLVDFEGPTNVADDYGSRIRGYIHPPMSGNYTFWIASDDRSELWLSKDGDPTNKVKIATVTGFTAVREWNKYSTQQSAPVLLTGGQKYYIEVLHKEAAGIDHLAVGWKLPNGTLERPVPGSRLSQFQSTNSPPVVRITSPVNGQTFQHPADISLSADASDDGGNIVKVEFYHGNTKLGEDRTAPYTFFWSSVAPGEYNVTAKAIDGLGASHASGVSIVVTGTVEQEIWTGIPGRDISSIPINSAPSSVSSITVFETPANIGDDYASRVRGYVCPPVTGDYFFWIASDDTGELWLSTDEDPLNKVKVAYVAGWTRPREWGRYASQKSVGISLTGGEKYYFEALLKEGTGADQLAVGWQLPDGRMERPIPGTRLIPFSSFADQRPLVTITSPKDGHNFTAPASVDFTVTASDKDGSIVKVEFYNGTARLGEDVTSPYVFSWKNVPPGNYAVTAKATDNAGLSSTATVEIMVKEGCVGAGTVTNEVWTGIPGRDISSIPVNNPPSSVSDISLLETPANIGDNYGSRVRGYLCAPTTGNYLFWIASDDSGEFWLSTNEDPLNKVKVAYVAGWTRSREWGRYASQKSVAITLTGGQRYYFEALLKEGTGADQLAVGWQLPDGRMERPIPGTRLIPFSSFADQRPLVTITSPEDEQNFTAPASVDFTVTASDKDGSIVKVEFYNGTARLGEDVMSPYAFRWNNVPAGNHTVTAKATDNAGLSSSATVEIMVKEGCVGAGSVTNEVWTGIPGRDISSIPVNNPPSSVSDISLLETPAIIGDNYGSRVRGYLCAPTTGNYLFWIASDDSGEFWLSINEDPLNKVKVAYVAGWTRPREWGKYTSQKSVAITLTGGQRYYFEALLKEGTGADQLAVGWQLPDGRMERPIPGMRLMPFTVSEDATMARMAAARTSEAPKIEIMDDVEAGLKRELQIYPNPASKSVSRLTISLSPDHPKALPTRIVILRMTGEVVYSTTFTLGENSRSYSIPVNALNPGMYVVRVITNDRRSSKSLLIR